MSQGETGAVFRVCAVDEHRWDVLLDSAREPVASFADKHSALAYAMNLARGRARWPPCKVEWCGAGDGSAAAAEAAQCGCVAAGFAPESETSYVIPSPTACADRPASDSDSAAARSSSHANLGALEGEKETCDRDQV
jgi:hypothetical protein